MKVYYEFGKDDRALINRERFLGKLGLSEKNVIGVKSVNGDNTEIVTKEDRGNFIYNTDGLITNEKNVYLSITIADCLPIVIFDPQKEVIGLIHSGWKGLEKKIIENAIKKMELNFGVNSKELLAGIGPGIGVCHFEVKEDFPAKFKSYSEAIIKKDGKSYVDLKLIAKRQMEEAGVKPENIYVSSVCTYCQADTYFSYRKDKSEPVQAMMFIAGMK
ncbi:MAG: peptidoglycan editing factor PgeF [Actinobacteria bacterium]|nr:peptidoglycan editing factor PgeF [Actinomycetota bacterium]